MKVVINQCWGGFGLSEQALERYTELKNIRKPVLAWQIKERNDPALVQTVEELGDKASDELAELSIIEIPDGTRYTIHDYDGMESIHEIHRSWP